MERRSALRNIALGMGYTVAIPTVVSILESCQGVSTDVWTPSFLTESEFFMVNQLADIIIPKTDIVGAIDVDVPQLIDALYNEVETDESKEIFRKGAAVFAFNFKAEHYKDITKGTPKEIEALLHHYLDLNEENRDLLKYNQSLAYDEVPPQGMESYLVYHFLLSVRQKTLMGYYTSEVVGETILAYDPIPGIHIPCGDLEELTQGKAWSL